MAYLEVRNLTKQFGNSVILGGISFDVNEGEVVSLIGSSGAGKTTALRSLCFLEMADSGTITLNGELIYDGNSRKKRYKEEELRKMRSRFGLVFQSFNLFPQYTAFDNIKLPVKLKEKEKEKNKEPFMSETEIDLAVNALLTRVGLADKAKLYPYQLSGGQKQRVAIARAIAMKPDVLLFDEPTSALDPSLTNEVLKVINEIKEAYGITMIIVTHEMEFAKNISDKIIFLNDGYIEEEGTPEEIFENPKSEVIKKFLSSYSLKKEVK